MAKLLKLRALMRGGGVQPPGAPTNLAVTSVLNGSIAPQINFTLTWDAVSGATSYVVRAYTNSGLSAQLTLTDSGAAASNSYTFNSADPKYLSEYWLTVQAVGAGGSSAESAALPILTPLPSSVTDWFFAGTRSDLLNGGTTEDSSAVDPCEDTDAVYNWRSVKGTYLPTQATQASRPIFHASGMGTPSRPYLEFTGSHVLQDDSADPVVIDGSEYTIYIVITTAATGASSRIPFSIYNSAVANRLLRMTINAGVENRSNCFHQGALASVSVNKDVTVNNDTPHFLTAEKVTGPTTTFYVDGVAGTNSTNVTGTTSADRLRIGGWFQSGSEQAAYIGGIGLLAFFPSAMRATSYNGETVGAMLKRFYGTP